MGSRRPLRIGNASGFFGDRLSALREIVLGGEVDVVCGDYLAEVTMLVLAKTRMKDPAGGGYARTFLRQLDGLLEELVARDVRVVVNAGGLSPGALAGELRGLAGERGLADELGVAVVSGDDLMPRLDELRPRLSAFDGGAPLDDFEPLTANAYLGGWGIAAALDAGARIVVCGRVTDASLVVGPAAWWHGWERSDWDALAGAVVAGHVIECGAHATGGNYSGFRAIPALVRPGFPIAEVADDGSSVIAKPAGSDGAVTTGTVTAQLLYEIQGLDYLNPDVSVALDSVRLADEGGDRVRVSAVRGGPPPTALKVALTALGGHRNGVTFVLTGLDLSAKAALLEAQVRAALDGHEGVAELRVERIGTAAEDPDSQAAGTVLVRVVATGTREAVGRPFSSALVELALSSYPGLFVTAPPGEGSSFGSYRPALIERAAVEHLVELPDGATQVVADPPCDAQAGERGAGGAAAGSSEAAIAGASAAATAHAGDAATADADEGTVGASAQPTAPPDGPTRRVPLGLIADARAGDKGANANLGVWVADDDAWAWLRSMLTTDALRALLPELAELPIDRYELPNLRALNFVVHGLLAGGATATLRFDNQAKALGEWLRARHVDIPVALLDRPGGG